MNNTCSHTCIIDNRSGPGRIITCVSRSVRVRIRVRVRVGVRIRVGVGVGIRVRLGVRVRVRSRGLECRRSGPSNRCPSISHTQHSTHDTPHTSVCVFVGVPDHVIWYPPH